MLANEATFVEVEMAARIDSPAGHCSSVYAADALLNNFEDKKRRAIPDSLLRCWGEVINLGSFRGY